MKTAITILYIMAGILTTNMSYSLDKQRGNVEIPAAYVALGIAWPILSIISTIGILSGVGYK